MTTKKADLSAAAEPRMTTGAEILVQSLIRNKIETIFAYPGGFSILLHQAFSHYRDKIRVVLPRHEQGGGFAAQGYARASGKIGVVMTTSGPGATNLVTSIADAKLDSVPLLIITGQVPTSVIGSDGFQETPMTEVCRSITKHHYLVTDVKDLTRIINEAIFVATTGRPGPVLVDIPKDVQTDQIYPDFDPPLDLPGYSGKSPKPSAQTVCEVVAAIRKARRPVLLVGGGVVMSNASDDLKTLAEKTGIPVATTMPGLSAFPRTHALSLGMAGMHGTVYANRAIKNSDLLIAVGMRFSDRVIGRASEFAKMARVIHVDIDPSEFEKVKSVDMTVESSAKDFFKALLKALPKDASDLTAWYKSIDQWKEEYPIRFKENPKLIQGQYAIRQLSEATQGKNVIITTGVGQHQMWTTLFYQFSRPRTWLSSCGLGTMGFGLPAAMGAKMACPDACVIDIDGDGSFQMNIQEMATCVTENIPVKVMLLDNQFLGNVMMWVDIFYKSNRGNTYLGPVTDPEATGPVDSVFPPCRYPDYPTIARGFGWESELVDHKSAFPEALQRMLASNRPFLLDVRIPYHEHVLPFIPPGGTVEETVLG